MSQNVEHGRMRGDKTEQKRGKKKSVCALKIRRPDRQKPFLGLQLCLASTHGLTKPGLAAVSIVYVRPWTRVSHEPTGSPRARVPFTQHERDHTVGP
jgi:hypothetical protein